MSEFENTMELSINPYDDLIEQPSVPVVSPVILNVPGKKDAEIRPADPVEIIPLAADVIHKKIECREYAVLWSTEIELEEDLLVPDTEPDMESVLNIAAAVEQMRVHEGEGGSCEIRGTVKLDTLYRSAGVYNNVLSVISTEIPFKRNAGEIDGQIPDIIAGAKIKKTDIHIINERKYRVKIQMTAELRTIRQQERSWFGGVDGEELYLKKEPVKFANIISRKTRDSEVDEELLIDSEKIRPLKILRSSFTAAENHRKLTHEKLIINSTIWVRIIYMAEIASKGNLSGQPMLFLGKIDHTQFFMLGKNESGAAACITSPDAGGLKVEINDAATGFRVTGDVLTAVTLYGYDEEEIVTDFYHGTEEVTCDMKETAVCSGVDMLQMEQTIRESISLHENGSEGTRLIYLDASVTESHTEVTDKSVIVRGRIQLEAVTINDGDYTIAAKKMCDFTCTADIPDGEADVSGSCGIRVEDAAVMVREMSGDITGGHQISITAHVQVQAAICYESRPVMIANPCLIRGERRNRDYPLTVYTVKENETVWDIAKRFRVAEENITAVNKAEDIQAGRKIVIAK